MALGINGMLAAGKNKNKGVPLPTPAKTKTVAASGNKGSQMKASSTTTKENVGGDKGFALSTTPTSKTMAGGDKGFPLVPTAKTTQTGYSDAAGKTDWSKLIREELDKGSGADAGVLQGYLDARNQKITSDPSLAQYANDSIAREARAYIEAQKKPQYEGFDASGYTAAQQAQDAYLQAKLKQTVAGLEAQKGSVNDSAEEAARQAYVSYMQSRNALPQALAASGYAGGMADSQRLALDTNLQNSQQNILKSRDAALNDIDTAVSNARLETSVQGAQAQAELARDAIAAYQNFINQQNSFVHQDFWTKQGYDFQAGQAALDREFQNNTRLEQQKWQEEQSAGAQEDTSKDTVQKQAYETAWNLISVGLVPDAGTLTLAGIKEADAQAYAAYIQKQIAAQQQKKNQTYSWSGGDGYITDSSIIDPLDTGKKDDTGGGGGTVATEQQMQEFKNTLTAVSRMGTLPEQHLQNVLNAIWNRTSPQQQKELEDYIRYLGGQVG